MFNNESMNTMVKKLEEMYKAGVRLERVFPKTQDAIFQVATGGKILVSEKDDGKPSAVRVDRVSKVKLVQHGIWDVTLQSGEKYRRNILTHMSQTLS